MNVREHAELLVILSGSKEKALEIVREMHLLGEKVCPQFDIERWNAAGSPRTDNDQSEFPSAADDGEHRLLRVQKVWYADTTFRKFLVCRCGCEFSTDPSELSPEWNKMVPIK